MIIFLAVLFFAAAPLPAQDEAEEETFTAEETAEETRRPGEETLSLPAEETTDRAKGTLSRPAAGRHPAGRILLSPL